MEKLEVSEQKIIGTLLADAIEKGLLVSVYDGEVWTVKSSASLRDIKSAIGTTDETTLRFRDPSRLNERNTPASVGIVQLIHGNGCDVISDHTDTPEMAVLLARAGVVADVMAAAQ